MNVFEARLERSVDWGEPRPIMTKRGGTLMRFGAPRDAFWELWKREKARLRKMGISPRKIGSGWEVAHFMDGQLHEITTENEIMNTAGLLEWQIKPMKHLVGILRDHISAIDSSDTGTGKTFGMMTSICPSGSIHQRYPNSSRHTFSEASAGRWDW